jgi:hypothetical protein
MELGASGGRSGYRGFNAISGAIFRPGLRLRRLFSPRWIAIASRELCYSMMMPLRAIFAFGVRALSGPTGTRNESPLTPYDCTHPSPAGMVLIQDSEHSYANRQTRHKSPQKRPWTDNADTLCRECIVVRQRLVQSRLSVIVAHPSVGNSQMERWTVTQGR